MSLYQIGNEMSLHILHLQMKIKTKYIQQYYEWYTCIKCKFIKIGHIGMKKQVLKADQDT